MNRASERSWFRSFFHKIRIFFIKSLYLARNIFDQLYGMMSEYGAFILIALIAAAGITCMVIISQQPIPLTKTAIDKVYYMSPDPRNTKQLSMIALTKELLMINCPHIFMSSSSELFSRNISKSIMNFDQDAYNTIFNLAEKRIFLNDQFTGIGVALKVDPGYNPYPYGITSVSSLIYEYFAEFSNHFNKSKLSWRIDRMKEDKYLNDNYLSQFPSELRCYEIHKQDNIVKFTVDFDQNLILTLRCYLRSLTENKKHNSTSNDDALFEYLYANSIAIDQILSIAIDDTSENISLKQKSDVLQEQDFSDKQDDIAIIRSIFEFISDKQRISDNSMGEFFNKYNLFDGSDNNRLVMQHMSYLIQGALIAIGRSVIIAAKMYFFSEITKDQDDKRIIDKVAQRQTQNKIKSLEKDLITQPLLQYFQNQLMFIDDFDLWQDVKQSN